MSKSVRRRDIKLCGKLRLNCCLESYLSFESSCRYSSNKISRGDVTCGFPNLNFMVATEVFVLRYDFIAQLARLAISVLKLPRWHPRLVRGLPKQYPIRPL